MLADPETRISAGGIGEGEGEKEDSWDSSVRITKAQVQAQHEGNKLHLLLPKYQILRYRNTHSLHLLLRRALILRGGLSPCLSLSNGSLSSREVSLSERGSLSARGLQLGLCSWVMKSTENENEMSNAMYDVTSLVALPVPPILTLAVNDMKRPSNENETRRLCGVFTTRIWIHS